MNIYVIDTDTLTLYRQGNPLVLRRVFAHASSVLAISVISVEEQLGGWQSLLRKAKKPKQLAAVYEEMAEAAEFLSGWRILPFPEQAIHKYEEMRKLKLNVKRMDLRIAATVLDLGGVLVTHNTRDFARVPNLAIEDWTL